jgi:hypothetical protein
MALRFDLELPPVDVREELVRADLTFSGIDHSGPSFEVRVFFDNPDATADTPLDAGSGFAGAFTVLGHGGCFGAEGHCDVRTPVTAYDRRLPHQLIPATRILIVTEAFDRALAAGADHVSVTAVPVVRPSALSTADQAADVLTVDQVSLHTYA